MSAAIPVNGEAESIASEATAWTLHASGERLLIIELHDGDRIAANRRARDFATRVAAVSSADRLKRNFPATARLLASAPP